MLTPRSACRVLVKGHVQGVGFRPFVQRLATELHLHGGVGNDSRGVFINLEGETLAINEFLRQLESNAPAPARVESLKVESSESAGLLGFRILECPPSSAGPHSSRVPCDRGLCADCRAEVFDPVNRRYQYAMTACTTCGPRYTILRTIPYDRAATAMDVFPLCRACSSEFGDCLDRRFHAEVMSCPECGPRIQFVNLRSPTLVPVGEPVQLARASLEAGQILALKGLGGYQLLTRADNPDSVRSLRKLKRRPTKPLAIMVSSLEQAEVFCEFNHHEREALLSPENPIVLLRRKGKRAEIGEHAGARFCDDVAPHLDQLGVFLPTTPLHDLLLHELPFPVVATSGNRGEEPIHGEEATFAELAELADVCLRHDRAIERRLDDSVVRVIAGKASTIRLARGFAPLALPNLERWLQRATKQFPPGVLALGGQQKNALALSTGEQAILGPHVGDLDSPAALDAWREHRRQLAELYGAEIRVLVADRHPDYAATRWAHESGQRMVEVFHHHAHAAAAMVEYDLLDRTVLALTWDGTGLGPDGSLWGGECLRASLGDAQRVATVRPITLAGGEAAIHEPWRIGLALLHEVNSDLRGVMDDLEKLWPSVAAKEILGVQTLLGRPSLCQRTTSMGRLFDGVASLLLGVRDVSYEGEAAAWLESVCDSSIEDAYPVDVDRKADIIVWDWRSMVRALLVDLKNQVAPSICAVRFHNAIARWAQLAVADTVEVDVVLTGGCFQNALLTERVAESVTAAGKRVHTPGVIPVNDGGLAVGQLALGLAWLIQGG